MFCLRRPRSQQLSGTNAGCPSGYELKQGDIPGTGSVDGAGAFEKVAHCDKCAKLCSERAGCLSFECSPTELKCNLNPVADPVAVQYKDYMFCKKDTGCPHGYDLKEGDIAGTGSVDGAGNFQKVAHCDECARLCSARPRCLSYECSPTALQCNLNAAADPVDPQHLDYRFCKKSKSCALGYELKQGDIAGTGSVAGAGAFQQVAHCDECAKLCSARPGCLSYECSPTTLKCNLNSAADPIEPQHLDYNFCKKSTGCAPGYQLKQGDIPGTGSVDGAGNFQKVAHCDECATLCSIRSGCLSYECSPTELKCNLNSAADPTAQQYMDYMFCKKGSAK